MSSDRIDIATANCDQESGKVWSCGYNGEGQLGIGTNVHQREWQPIVSISQEKIKAVRCGPLHSMALTGTVDINVIVVIY